MRRILAVHPSDELYGADRIMLEAASVLGRRGPVTVWLPDDVDYPDRPLTRRLADAGVRASRQPIPVLRRASVRPAALPALLRRMWRTWRAIGREDAGLVYLSTSAVLPVAPLAKLRGARVVLHLHESWSRLDRLLLTPLLWWCDEVVAVSVAAAHTLPTKRKVTVVHNGIELSPRLDARQRVEVRSRVGAGEGDVVVVVASRWNAWKGHETLLAAWHGLARRDAHLVILGGAPVAGRGVDVEALVAAGARRDSVHVVGELEDVHEWFEAADVVAMPSTGPEPFGLVALEASALGTAVFASRTGGLPEIVVDGQTGRLLEPGDVAAWRAALEEAVVSELATLGKSARLRYEERFTGARFARAFAQSLAPRPERKVS